MGRRYAFAPLFRGARDSRPRPAVPGRVAPHPARGRSHRAGEGSNGAARGRRSAAEPGPEDGGARSADLRHRARLQQSADRHLGKCGVVAAPRARPRSRIAAARRRGDARSRSGRDADPAAPGLLAPPTARPETARGQPADRRDVGSPAPHFGEEIEPETVLAGGLWPVLVDANQLEHSLLNLAINARDAMASGGKLTIETANTLLDESYAARHEELAPGQYVMISVSDTGSGMSAEVREKAFEPFFTTKETGQGTGLGLSQVYGFIKQSGGHCAIYSEPGQGTTVRLCLPRHLGDVQAVGLPESPRAGRGRGEMILFVEDDADVRIFATDLLRELGYAVLAAATGIEGLSLLEAHPEVRRCCTYVSMS